MTVAPGSDQAKEAPRGVSSPSSRAPRTLQPVEALITRRRLSALAIEQGIKGATFMVWSFLLDSTICWQRETEHHFHAYIAAQTGLSKRAVAVAVTALEQAGLIAYEAGGGSEIEGRNKPSKFTILNVRDDFAGGGSHQDVAPVSHGDVTGVPHLDVAPLRTRPGVSHADVPPSHTRMGPGATQPCNTGSHGDVTYRGENSPREELPRENTGVGAHVVHLEPTAPSGADAQSVLDAYCALRAERGTPVVRPKPYLSHIREALSAGYSSAEVLIGLGMWDAEGYRTPRQIPEWVEKSTEQGGARSTSMSAPELLDEGRRRFERYSNRKAIDRPSSGDLRRDRSMAAIREFNERAP